MKESPINDDLPPLTARGIRDLQACQSAPAPSEPPAPQGSLRCDGVVGLPVLRAQKLIQIWEERARVRDVLANESRTKGSIEEALPLENSADAYEACAQELRRELGLPIPRQPEPNTQDDTDARHP